MISFLACNTTAINVVNGDVIVNTRALNLRAAVKGYEVFSKYYNFLECT